MQDFFSDLQQGVYSQQTAVSPRESDFSDRGTLRIDVTSTIAIQPITDARIRIYNGTSLLEEIRTDSSGQSETLTLQAPPSEYSMEPGQPQPYTQYTIQVEAEGYRPVEIADVEVFPDELSIQPVVMQPLEVSNEEGEENIVIPPNT
ncbi:MAG: carboxypeptidase-like regulatory domain-containing protein, partial [Clostridiales bacterium]|nr:carboxypeptidase-like regulatory domain-containing protein [Clostridiales bacterium]